MESIVVHPRNAMELSALKSVLKEMNIKFEKFHTRNNFQSTKAHKNIGDKKNVKPASKPSKPKGQ